MPEKEFLAGAQRWGSPQDEDSLRDIIPLG
jgi:hypothetical protein